ncbi:MAG: hypothetical protein B6D58_03350 [candidate division Zixibacteria bacterium 4484_95]|nr:MAG: hypothetical protein B6D58_03350 [candidate division Zixibacteria bacterium 4484_95]
MNPHTLEVLEFYRVVEKLHDFCWSVPAKRFEVLPSTNVDEVKHSLDCLSEMFEIYRFDGGPPSLLFDDVNMILEKHAADGAVLEPFELIKVAEMYDVVKGFIHLDDKYPNLNKLTSQLVHNEGIITRINRVVQPPNEIKDDASPKLRDIRKQLRQTREKLEAKYNSYLDSKYSAYLSDNVITVREGRYVLPVREGAKGKIKGVIHDRSSTGATFFIEPFEAVELNNSYREIMVAERQEIYCILRSLTDAILDEIEAIKDNIRILIRLDIYSAKARLARKLDCHRPQINTDNYINIKNGYHPLLRWHDKQNNTDETIPIDIELGKNFTTLVITGPNTGGKTVALKTVGLLCLMVQSGMFIPAGEDSTMPVFKDIFTDIGDEQSLEASLSTFSAHLANIRYALEKTKRNCLVLLDELGAGTDPDEGVALGQAIIENLTQRKVPTIVTTHHGRLKALAVNIAGVENGSLDFDRRNLRPTYRFRIGVPGMSYGVETARKLGLNGKITDRAESLIDRSERKLAGIINQLSDRLKATEENLQKAQEHKLSYESLAQLYTDKLDNIKKEKKRIKKEALEEAERMILETKAEIEKLIDSAKKSEKKVEALRAVKHQADVKIKNIKEQVKSIEPPPRMIAAFGKVGEKVYLPDIDVTGEVIEKVDRSGKIRVRVGNAIVLTELRRLFKATADDESYKAQQKGYSIYEKAMPDMQINLRGLTYDEAQPILDKYLDDVYLAGFDSVSVIHGKGTGTLRTKIQEFLKKHHRVKSFRLGNWDEGSYGVTIVEIKKD